MLWSTGYGILAAVSLSNRRLSPVIFVFLGKDASELARATRTFEMLYCTIVPAVESFSIHVRIECSLLPVALPSLEDDVVNSCIASGSTDTQHDVVLCCWTRVVSVALPS